MVGYKLQIQFWPACFYKHCENFVGRMNKTGLLVLKRGVIHKLSRGENCVANFIPPHANGASLVLWVHSHEKRISAILFQNVKYEDL